MLLLNCYQKKFIAGILKLVIMRSDILQTKDFELCNKDAYDRGTQLIVDECHCLVKLLQSNTL
jgi:hypothetical protein